MTDWVEWADGIRVTKADFNALTRDLHLFGNAMVETIGDMRGRRIAPESFFMRAAPKQRIPTQARMLTCIGRKTMPVRGLRQPSGPAAQSEADNGAAAMRKYAHMCRDGHAEIGHNDSEYEVCPLCRALSALRECADDLTSEILARYPLEVRRHPGMARRFERDMAPVLRANEILGSHQ